MPDVKAFSSQKTPSCTLNYIEKWLKKVFRFFKKFSLHQATHAAGITFIFKGI